MCVYLKYNILNKPILLYKIQEKEFEWYFTSFITGWFSVFEWISWMNDSMTNTFLI